MFDLADFDLRHMTELGAGLRRLGHGAHSMEEVADRVVHLLYDQARDRVRQERSLVLVRFFATQAYGALDAGLQTFARRLLRGTPPSPAMRCLVLLATAGDRPEWNDRNASVNHRAIPLASEEMIATAPMIAGLLGELGVEVAALLRPMPEILVEHQHASFNVFHVPEAAGSPHIPAQREFVEPAAVRSVLGFGGVLPSVEVFAVILFSRVRIPSETAELFKTLALNVKLALLPFDRAVFT